MSSPAMDRFLRESKTEKIVLSNRGRQRVVRGNLQEESRLSDSALKRAHNFALKDIVPHRASEPA